MQPTAGKRKSGGQTGHLTPSNFFVINDESDWQRWLCIVSSYFVKPKIINSISINKNDNRYYATISVLDRKYCGLLDSGATVSVISKSFYDKLKLLGMSAHDCPREIVSTADGSKHAISLEIYLPVCFSRNYHVVSFFVMDNLNHDIILGMNFFKSFGISLTLQNMEDQDISSDYNYEIAEISINSALVSREFLTHQEENRLQKLIDEMKSDIGIGLGRTNLIEHKIETGDESPVKQRQYPFAPPIMKELEAEISDMLKQDVIEPSYSCWQSPVLLVKKSNGKNRLCLDSRQLNRITKKDSYPLPRVSAILDNLKNAKFLTTIDLKSAFWQVPLEESSKEKTAFGLAGKGLYQFKVMPFGLSNASQTQQRLMDRLFPIEHEGNVFTYLDDIVLVNSNFDDHLDSIRHVKDQLKVAGLTVNMEKCVFARPSLKYLGYIIDKDGLRTDPDKVNAILNYPRPGTYTELKRFIGLASWYRRFVENFAIVAAPLHDLTKGTNKSKTLKWTVEAEVAFVKLKTLLTNSPVLRVPDFDKEFSVQCDASNKGIGAVLTQSYDGGERPVAFASRKLSDRETRYSASERELLAVIHAVEQFRPYVEGSHFKVISDHSALQWLHKNKDPHGRLARWAMKLQQFNYEIVHRKGKDNTVPDALSRSIPEEINIIEITPEDKDDWYRRLEEEVRQGLHTNDWEISNNQLWKYLKLKEFPDVKYDWKLVVLESLRLDVLKECHDHPTSGHFGVKKSITKTRQHYYWPSLIKDVKKYVRECEICAKYKSSQLPPSGMMGKHRTVTEPFQILSLDLMGPFPRSRQGNTMLLVISCWFSKFCLLFPLRNGKAANITRIIEEQVFLVFGAPNVIICDNGKQFVSSQFKDLAVNYGVDLWYTPYYHPQANPTERVNKVIGTAIASYIGENHKDWDKNIPQIGHALRTAVHEVTRKTPSYLLFGRETSVLKPKNIRFDENEHINFNRDEYEKNLALKKSLHENVSNHLRKSYEKNKTKYDLRHRHCDYKVGDMVWKRTKYLSNAGKGFMSKLAPKFEKGIIVEKLSTDVYNIKSLRGKDLGNWHSSDIKGLVL